MAPVVSCLATFGLILASFSSFAVVASPTLQAHELVFQEQQEANLQQQQQHTERAVDEAELLRRMDVFGQWKDCEHNNATSEWGEIYGGCHSKHAPTSYLSASDLAQYQQQVRLLLNETLGGPRASQEIRSQCTKEQNKQLCVSWSNHVIDHLAPEMLEAAADKASKCMHRFGYSAELALWTFSGERVYVCISDRTTGCKARLCT